MASTDRAFRALARAEPSVVLALLRVALPGLFAGKGVDATSVEEPKLDLPAPLEADLAVRIGEGDLLHVEGQSYRERTFDYRVFRYHLALVLRHPQRRVTTVALWLTRPADALSLDRIERSGVSVSVTSLVLANIPASQLLDAPDAVCFAPGAHAGSLSNEELCRSVARALRKQQAGWHRLLLSVSVAAAAGRYDVMIAAMHEEELEPPIIEDLVRYGRERGFREGVEAGREAALHLARETLVDLLSVRGLSPTADEYARIAAENALERLHEWLRCAVRAKSMSDVFEL